MRPRLLADEVPTKQDAHLTALKSAGVDVEVDSDFDTDNEPAWGSDPFTILAHREDLDQDH